MIFFKRPPEHSPSEATQEIARAACAKLTLTELCAIATIARCKPLWPGLLYWGGRTCKPS